MPNDNNFFTSFQSKNPAVTALTVFLSIASVLLALLVIGGIIKLAGSGNDLAEANTITVTGEGEAFAVPNIATISYNVRAEGTDVTATQEEVTTTSNQVLEALKEFGIEEKDIQTSNYSANPRYQYRTSSCRFGDCPDNRVLVGYEVNSTVTVKVRKVEDAGKVLGLIGGFKVSDINGPNLEIDNQDAVLAEARDEAIQNARAKAEDLADELGVRLGKVVSFSEGGNYPMYARGKVMLESANDMAASAGAAPSIAVGENQVISNVSLTYKIR